MALTTEQERQARHLVAHAARILLFVDSHPDLPNRAEYDAQMDIYRARWLTVPAADRARIPAELIVHPELGDLTHDAVVSALAALTDKPRDLILAAIDKYGSPLATVSRDALIDERGVFTFAARTVVAQITAALEAQGV